MQMSKNIVSYIIFVDACCCSVHYFVHPLEFTLLKGLIWGLVMLKLELGWGHFEPHCLKLDETENSFHSHMQTNVSPAQSLSAVWLLQTECSWKERAVLNHPETSWVFMKVGVCSQETLPLIWCKLRDPWVVMTQLSTSNWINTLHGPETTARQQ